MIKKVSIHNFVILDFEASSLSRESWPIEVGLGWVANDCVQTWTSLIRPDPAWDLGDWSPQSAEVHGISLPELEDSPPAAEVANAFLDVLGRRQLVSDAPEFEERWLKRLLRTSSCTEMLPIEDFDGVSFAMFDGYALDVLYKTITQLPAPHRAGPDAARLATGWLKATECTGPEGRGG